MVISRLTAMIIKVKVKVWKRAIVPLTWVRLVTSNALQSRKWHLIGMSLWFRSALCGHPLLALTDNWTHDAASRHTIPPISHTRPSPRSRSSYSFPVLLRVGGWVALSTQYLVRTIQTFSKCLKTYLFTVAFISHPPWPSAPMIRTSAHIRYVSHLKNVM